MSAIVTLFVVIYTSGGTFSERRQDMTLAECQADIRATQRAATPGDIVTGTCIQRNGK